MHYYQLNVFTKGTRFSGNQLAVVTDFADDMPASQMQQWAREFNFSETVFLNLHTHMARIFTPSMELPFAGHPTIGAAWLLGHLKKRTGLTKLYVDRGEIDAQVTLHGAHLPFPGAALIAKDQVSAEHLAILNLAANDIGPHVYRGDAGPEFKMIEVKTAEALIKAKPNLGQVEKVRVYLYHRKSEHEFKVRMFGLSLPEDPATGSAACALGGLLQQIHGIKTGHFVIHQGDEMQRPSEIQLTLNEQIHIGGSVQLVLDAQLY